MKIPCDLILDLLPLYQHGLCSERSESIITEHLTICDECYNVLSKMDTKIVVPRYEINLIEIFFIKNAQANTNSESKNG